MNRLTPLFAFIVLSTGVAYSQIEPAEPTPTPTPSTALPRGESKRGSLRFGTFEAFSLPDYKVDQALQTKILEEIQILTGIAKQTRDLNRRADILFRIAELYWLDERSRYLRGMANYNLEFDLFMKGQRKVKPVEPKFSGERSFKIYQNVITSAPKYDRMDEVLFLAGFHALEAGKKGAVDYFKRLVRDYTKSKFRLDAYMEIAEDYFLNRDFNKAIETYHTVIKEPSKLYNFALYKLAWCYYNQQKVRPGITILQKVVSTSKGVKNEIELREEALRDLVLFYSDLGYVDEAQQYFVSIGEPAYGRKVLEKLANIYFEQSRYEKAIETLRKLLAADPFAEDAPKYHSKLIDSYEKSEQLAMAMNEMENFISLYDKSSLWNQRNSDPDAKDYANKRSEVYARFIPKKYHEAAQKAENSNPTQAAASYDKAVIYYRKYLDAFGDHVNAYDTRFLYAGLLFKRKDYATSSEQFAAVVRANPKGKYSKDALIGQVDSLSRLEEVYFRDLEKKGIKQKNKYDPLPLSQYAQQLIDADEHYVQLYTSDDRVPDTLLHRSQLFYNYNQFDKALKGFFVIVQKYPTSPASNTSRNLILDIYNIRKDWANLEKWASTFLADAHFATPDNRAFLLKLIQGSIFQRAKEMEDKKQYAAAAETYMRLTDKYPDSEYADKALFNAAISYINGDDSEKAMATAQRFLKKYPDSSMTPKMMLALATYFDDKLHYENAAYYYELLAERDPKSTYAADALFNAGLYRENLRHFSRALQDYQTYLERYPKLKDAPEIFFSIGMIHEKTKNWKEAAATFQAFPNRFGNRKDRVIESYYRYGQAMEKLNQKGAAEKAYRTAVYLFRKYNTDPNLGPTIGGKYAAQAHMELLSADLAEYDSIRLRLPQKVLESAMERKAILLKQLKNRYLEIINYGDAEMGVAALYQIGLVYQRFSEALFKAPLPKGLTPEQVQLYQQELQNRAAPIEEKAVEAYEKAVKKAFELEVYTDWSKRAYDRLTQYKPNQYPLLRGEVRYGLYISQPTAEYKGATP